MTYAVLETGGKQYQVGVGDMLQIERVSAEPGQILTFDRVLLVKDEAGVAVGAPTVDNARVEADVVEHRRSPKVVAFKMKRRKGYQRKIGHRQELTVVRIREIKTLPSAAESAPTDVTGPVIEPDAPAPA